MPGAKTNERPGTRAVLRHYRMSATKARQVLDLVRGLDVDRAHELLRSTPREGARVVLKVLDSAVANARNNDGLDPEELYISACYADEGTTVKRWRPRARGRATRIRKRTCHITVIVSRLPEDRLVRRRARAAQSASALRSRRVAASRREERAAAPAADEAPVDEVLADDELVDEAGVDETGIEVDEVGAEDVEAEASDGTEASDEADAAPADEGDAEEKG
jgi:large subunit ribosomal protein L22